MLVPSTEGCLLGCCPAKGPELARTIRESRGRYFRPNHPSCCFSACVGRRVQLFHGLDKARKRRTRVIHSLQPFLRPEGRPQPFQRRLLLLAESPAVSRPRQQQTTPQVHRLGALKAFRRLCGQGVLPPLDEGTIARYDYRVELCNHPCKQGISEPEAETVGRAELTFRSNEGETDDISLSELQDDPHDGRSYPRSKREPAMGAWARTALLIYTRRN